ncbi:unnamed protein product [Aphanomyces euteiches]
MGVHGQPQEKQPTRALALAHVDWHDPVRDVASAVVIYINTGVVTPDFTRTFMRRHKAFVTVDPFDIAITGQWLWCAISPSDAAFSTGVTLGVYEGLEGWIAGLFERTVEGFGVGLW